MTTHRHAWKRRAGVVVALVSSALLALPSTPALAVDPDVGITNLSAGSLASGEKATLQFTVKNNNPAATTYGVQVEVFDGLSCSGDCDVPARLIEAGQSATFTATLTAGTLAPGQNKSGSVRVSAGFGADQDSDSRNLTVRGPQQQQPTQPAAEPTVKEISGRVTDTEGKPLPNASVALLDSRNHSYSTTTSGSGSFKFVGSAQNPITPGQIDLGASLDDKTAKKRISASANQTLQNQRIALNLGAPTPSASAEAPTPTDEAAAPGEETEATEGAEAPGQQAASNESGSSGGMGAWLLIIVGGLLVALGVGAIVLLWMRRKENGDEDEVDSPTGPRSPAAGGGGYQSGADPTRVTNRAGMGGDATSIDRSLADAPTMMHNRPLVDDEFPDPYGAPLPSQQPPTAVYGAAGQGGWAENGYGGAPAQGEYGAGGYDNAQGGGYGNAPGSGAGGYGGAPANGYGPGGEYGNAPGSGAGGYGNAPGAGAGGYGGAPGADGYGNAPGSGAGGYGNAGYGAAEQPGAGYPPAPAGAYPQADQNGRYDEPTGRYDGPSAGGNEYAPPADPYAQGGSYGAAGANDGGRGGYGADQQAYGGQGYGQGAGYGTPTAGAGYDQQGGDGYGAGAAAGRGYGEQPGYGAGPAGGYDQPQAGGYDQRAGGGYDQQQRGGGYDDRGGYDQQQGGYYDESAQGGGHGRGGAAPGGQQPNRGGERRSLDWLDD